MNGCRAFLAIAFLCWSVMASFADEQLSRIWKDPKSGIAQRYQAVGRAFTNGMPVSVVVASLGTNYTRYLTGFRSPGPPRLYLSYHFGKESVEIYTSAGSHEDPLSATFTGVGCTWLGQPLTVKTNQF